MWALAASVVPTATLPGGLRETGSIGAASKRRVRWRRSTLPIAASRTRPASRVGANSHKSTTTRRQGRLQARQAIHPSGLEGQSARRTCQFLTHCAHVPLAEMRIVVRPKFPYARFNRAARSDQGSGGSTADSVGGTVQVEAIEQIVGVSVALRQPRQAVTGLNHLQDRGGVIERVIHEGASGER